MRGVKIGDTATENEYESATNMSNGQARTGEATASSSCPVSVTLSASDIPGADLSEPWESHAVAALSWWLLCRGVKAPTGCRGKKLLLVDPISLSPWVT